MQYNVTDFDVFPNTEWLVTAKIQSLIDNFALKNEPATLYFPEGIYRIGTLRLTNHLTIHLAKDALLKAADTITDYTAHRSNYEWFKGKENHHEHALLVAENIENFALIGEGIIDGNGKSPNFAVTDWANKPLRPVVMRLIGCKNITLKGVRFQNGASWMIHLHACSHVRIENITVFNHSNFNNDGIDLASCSDVTITNSDFDTDDDCICVKTLSPLPCENITIQHCTTASNTNGFKIGTETTGNISKVRISDLVMSSASIPSHRRPTENIGGISVITTDGATVSDIDITRITMKNIPVPFFIKIANRARKYVPQAPTPPIGKIEHIKISEINVKGAFGLPSIISGLPSSLIKNIVLQDINIEIIKAGVFDKCIDEIPENEASYPTNQMLGDLPANTFFIRHTHNILISGVAIIYPSDEKRPAIACYRNKEKCIFV
jgi:polygalacturonase